mmetsp:Transcript_25250/g.80730  ORF Transcript_25250/g.80730 Transcript_25250/m.80730 type:complete len:237 (-) Transcript_25250:580-1290(-)
MHLFDGLSAIMMALIPGGLALGAATAARRRAPRRVGWPKRGRFAGARRPPIRAGWCSLARIVPRSLGRQGSRRRRRLVLLHRLHELSRLLHLLDGLRDERGDGRVLLFLLHLLLLRLRIGCTARRKLLVGLHWRRRGCGRAAAVPRALLRRRVETLDLGLHLRLRHARLRRRRRRGLRPDGPLLERAGLLGGDRRHPLRTRRRRGAPRRARRAAALATGAAGTLARLAPRVGRQGV